MCTQCTLCAGSGGRGTSTHTVHSCYCNTLTHLVLVLLVFDPSMKWTLEHKPTYMVCAVEPVWGKREGKRRKEGGEKRKERGKEEVRGYMPQQSINNVHSPIPPMSPPSHVTSLPCPLPPMSPPSHVPSLPCHLPILTWQLAPQHSFPQTWPWYLFRAKGLPNMPGCLGKGQSSNTYIMYTHAPSLATAIE